MSQETKKMLAIIEKQHKEAYNEYKKNEKRKTTRNKIDRAILNVFAFMGIILTVIAILTF